MKMTPEDAAALKTFITPYDTENNRVLYRTARLSDKRYQWDLVRHSGALPFVCDTLYKYLNDSHIDTALRGIVKPL